MKIDPEMCVRCKGTQYLCGQVGCPLKKGFNLMKGIEEISKKKELFGESQSVFVGSWNYPKVYTGPLSTKELVMEDYPESWYGRGLNDIVKHRVSLFRGKEARKVDEVRDAPEDLRKLQFIAMAEPETDTELEFKKKPRFQVNFDSTSPPFGPSEETKRLDLGSNPDIPRVVDKVAEDDIKASGGMWKLYEKGIKTSHISKVLSVGVLGRDENRKMVPTKWSITAADDEIGKKLREKIRDYNKVNDYLLFEGNYLGNFFKILVAPGNWSFDVVEIYTNKSLWSQGETIAISDHERSKGRKKYASDVAGGYYAARLAVLEWMKKNKRRGTAIVVREIMKSAPVGVWKVRETCRKTMLSEPTKFDTLNKALSSMREKLDTGKMWEKESQVLGDLKSRSILHKYIAKKTSN